MRGSFRIATLFGIPVELHWSFGLILVWIVYVGLGQGNSWTEIGVNILFILSLFVCVVFHEFGHALTARMYGVNTRDIILSPIGGIARLDRLPEKPIQELIVAAAGPAVNFAIAIILAPFFFFSKQGQELLTSVSEGEGITGAFPFLGGLIALNIILAVFNLLPAFPMDGGRILRALLSIKMGRLKATRLASQIGQGMAIVFVIYSIWSGSLITSLIGIFIFFTAGQEYQSVKMEALLDHNFVRDILRKQFTRIVAHDSMSTVASILNHGLERNFLVVDEEEEPIGTLPEKAIISAMKTGHLGLPVEQYLQTTPERLSESDTVKSAYEILMRSEHDILPVFEGDTLIGVLDMVQLNNFLNLKRKL